MHKYLIRLLAQTPYVRSAIEDRADLACFKQKPTPRIIWGLTVIGISYIIGWPAVALAGAVAIYLKKPIILTIGGPTVYIISHLTFMLGAWLAGAHYAKAFLRWATHRAMLKLIKYL